MSQDVLPNTNEGPRARRDVQAQACEPPNLILLCSWADAPRRAITKYTAKYAQLYPSAPLVLVESSFRDMLTRTEAGRRTWLAPVIKQLSALDQPRVLAHIFSNGGSYMLTQLAKFYRETYGAPLPLHALVLDSCPGGTEVRTVVRAIATVLPRQWYFYYPGWACICMYILLYALFTGKDNVIDRIRRTLNDPALISTEAPRLYVFSKQDDMVSWQAVSMHAENARKCGYNATTAEFHGSKHVAHAVKDPQRYWALTHNLVATEVAI